MIYRIPIVTSAFDLKDLLTALRFLKRESMGEKFKSELSETIPNKYLWLVNSGICAFYIILETLKKLSSR
ncbi:MAG: hypothetical protein N2Z79_04940, partial [Candidatus Omnitrophica bacterium]|nr:hypothetical protein [Candidatus Omnitrophota bacterium]